MQRKNSKGLVLLATIGAVLVAAPAVMAWGGGGGGDYDKNRPDRAVSYINPDTGAATANPDVNPNSSCFSPDQSRVSDFLCVRAVGLRSGF